MHLHDSHSHMHGSHQSQLQARSWMNLCMLIDGLGLAIIAACTILEGMDLWNDFFNEYWSSNSSSLGFWFCGRFLQTCGLFLLIAHAATFQIIHDVEVSGMVMLTVGPVLNLISCSLFDSGSADPFYLFNRQWVSNESLELIGIGVLDLSMIDAEPHVVVFFELLGFFILGCASVLDFDYTPEYLYPSISLRLELIHVSDCFGLFLLSVVAVMQYSTKVSKPSFSLPHNNNNNSLTGNSHGSSSGYVHSHGIIENNVNSSKKENFSHNRKWRPGDHDE